MLTEAMLQQILDRLPTLHLGVVGDLFLDRYLDLDARLTEASVETGLDAYQVVRVRAYPGAAGTVINNLVALGVGCVSVLSVIGQDGEGYELRRELERRQVDLRHLIETPERFTPTYTKPMLYDEPPVGQAFLPASPRQAGMPAPPPRELNRLDIKNRAPLSLELERQLLARLPALFGEVDALLVLDQVSEPECGVITTAMRERLAELGAADPAKMILADSRQRIGGFRNAWLKPNERECEEACRAGTAHPTVEDGARLLATQAGRPVFCTRGEQGILVMEPSARRTEVPAYRVTGPIDPVGAGDSTSAGIACAYAAGAALTEAAAFGNLVASITIQQIGVTGTATPAQVWQRWRAVATPR